MFIVICSCDFETFVICDIVSDCRCYIWKEPKYLHYAKLEVNSQSLLDPKTTSKYFTKYFKSCKKWIEHVKKKSTRQTSKQSRTESDNPPNANPFQNNNSSIVKHERNIELELKNKQSIKKIIYLALHMKGITKSNPEFPDLYRDLYEKTKTSLVRRPFLYL